MASPAVLADAVAVEVASPAIAGEVVVLEASPAVAGAASLADLAGVVTVGVASLANAGAASLADAGVASPADLAGVVTVGVASLTDAVAASLADAGVASPADFAWVVTVRVASLADAGAASLADAGVTLLAGLASGMMNMTVPVCERTEEVILVQKCPVRDCFVMHGSVTGDGGMDGDNCASPDGWYREMPDVCDDSIWQCVGYVGCDPDFVDRAVPEGGDEYPFRTLLSEPLCVIMDDMTFQEKTEALSGTIYDYDDVNDNTPRLF